MLRVGFGPDRRRGSSRKKSKKRCCPCRWQFYHGTSVSVVIFCPRSSLSIVALQVVVVSLSIFSSCLAPGSRTLLVYNCRCLFDVVNIDSKTNSLLSCSSALHEGYGVCEAGDRLCGQGSRSQEQFGRRSSERRGGGRVDTNTKISHSC